jgi:C-terminal domain on Strawberry notch homologue/P-loop containing NTP hydrolase pore-1
MSNQSLIQAYKFYFANGGDFPNIIAARNFGQSVLGLNSKIDRTHRESKSLEESIESAVIELSRDIVATSTTSGEAFDRLLDLHDRQPILSTRTSRSMSQQAYSTPIPLGYAASCLAGIDENTTVYEPAAGHGALLLGANPTKVWVNEIFQQRADELSKIYSRISLQDATNLSPGIIPKVDVVIANPPFGVVRGTNGATQRWQVGKYVSTQIDHAIAWQALERLKDNGKAVLIVGAPMAAKLAKDDAALLEAYSSKDKTFFYQTLLASYNVTEHYQINGELYRKQGTDFPVDMIVIEGRGASKRSPPSLQAPTKIRDWNQLKEVFNSERRINTTISLGSTSDGRRPGDAGEFLLDGGQQPTDRNQEPRPLPISNEGSVRSIGDNRSGSDELSGGSPVDARSTEASRDITPVLSRRVGGELGRSILPNDNLRERYADLSGMDATGRNFPSNNGSDNRPSEKDFSELSSSGLDGISDLPTNVYRLTEPSNGDQTMATQDQQTQVSYAPLSKGQSLGTLIPLNMRDKTATALSNVEQYAGKPIDAWVAEQLQWSQEHLTSVLAAEQIDAVALAINNISKDEALIVGDQTGNGKGRVLAALMRYALVNDLGVMFITEKDDLYKDILRDCDNIGLNINPVATNNSLRIPLGNGTVLRTGGKEKQDEIMQKIVEEGKLPSGNNAIFSTYSQMQTVQGKNTLRRDALKVLAPRSIVIMDESHNAGGSESNSYSKVGKPANRAEFARELVDLSIASIFSSATYAKNLTTLSLYTERTPLSKVVDGSDILIEMMGEGKVPLQQIVAAELAQSGHYIRRERSFEGIRFNNQELQVDTEVADKISAAMAAIVAFDKAKQEALNTVKGEMKAKGRYLQNDNATGESAIKSVNFTSLMHNVVGQSLLAQKVDGVIAASIEAIEKGQKPVIALSNTMGSIIEAYADEYDIQPGEDMNMDFSAVINRYLERSREYTVQSLVGTTRQRLNDEQLGIKAILLYEEAQERIQDLQNIGIPVSPIDYIKQGLATAGYRVGEITGRKHTLVYGDGLPRYAQRNGNETSKAAKIETIQQFNSGELDVVILNKSGSTGISLHSSETFSDRRPRHMILAQVDPDINIYLQMLGRVNRTGQINLPEYTIMTAGIPAEKRLTANLMRKMAALNANTTADRDSVHSVEGLDIFNFLGDQAAAQICAERPDLNAAMGLPIAVSEETDLDSIDLDGVILKVTGRIPLLPIEQQKEIYELIEGEYQVSLQRERAMGRDPLEAPNLDLKAMTISKAEIMSKRDDLAGTMGASVDVRIMEVNVLEKPLSQIQMANRIANNIGKPIIEIDDLDMFDLMDAGRDYTYGLKTSLDEEKRQYISRKTKPFEDIKKTELDADSTTNKVDKIDKEIDRTTAKINANAATVSNYMRFYPIGTAVHLFYKGDNYACKSGFPRSLESSNLPS